MKKIINGKVYDTATAASVGSWSFGNGFRDFHYVHETLYRKKTGEFFLHGEGGARTQYAEHVDQNTWSGGERIMPMSYAEAQKWAEEHLDGDEYEAIFGAVVEDDTKASVTYRLPASTVETLKRRAAEQGVGVSEYLESLLEK